MAVFSETGYGSSQCGARQLAIFTHRIVKFSGLRFFLLSRMLPRCLMRKSRYRYVSLESNRWTAPLFISVLTWNPENRFGGGASSSSRIETGWKSIITFFNGKGIAVDFSHASDALVEDILNEIDNAGLEIPLMASHSNSRMVYDVPRNLPDCFVKEIIARSGIIGINYVTRLLGEGKKPLMARHLTTFYP